MLINEFNYINFSYQNKCVRMVCKKKYFLTQAVPANNRNSRLHRKGDRA